MKLPRRDFLRAGGCGIASFISSPLWAQPDGKDEPKSAPRVVLTWGTNGSGDGEFDVPIAIAVSRRYRWFRPNLAGLLRKSASSKLTTLKRTGVNNCSALPNNHKAGCQRTGPLTVR